MIAKDDIVIRKAILHILDTNRGQCILSNTPIVLYLDDFINDENNSIDDENFKIYSANL